MKQQIKIEDIPQDFKSILPPRKRAKTKEEKEQRRIERIMRNRKAARQSRERKRQYMESLENKCNIMKQILDKVDLNEILSNNKELLNNYNDYIINDKELPEKQLDSPMESTSSSTLTTTATSDDCMVKPNNKMNTPISDFDIANIHSPLSSTNNSDDNDHDDNDSIDNSFVDFNFEPKVKFDDIEVTDSNNNTNTNNYSTTTTTTNSNGNYTNMLQMQWFQPITPPQVEQLEPIINWEFESNPAVFDYNINSFYRKRIDKL